MRRATVALLLALTVLMGGARAHTAGSTGFAVVTVHGQTVRYVLTLTTEVMPQHLAVGASDPASPAAPGSVQPPSPTRPTIVVTIDYACAAPLRTLSLTDNVFDVLGPDNHTLATVQWPEGPEQLLFEPDHRQARLALASEMTATPESGSAQSSPIAFFRVGVEHILTGYDHILFLFALILRGGRLRSLIGIVTAFTVAHSITLALA